MKAWLFYILAGIGALTCAGLSCELVRSAWRWAYRKWIWQRLDRRHKALCEPLNALWRHKIVRHAPTGRIGLVLKVCVLDSNWRDLVWPRWWADVTWRPAAAALALATPPGFKRFFFFQPGEFDVIRLGELTIAPGAEAEEFRDALRAARERTEE